MRVCSACAPTHYIDGKETGFGHWHDEFPRIFLPKRMFITNQRGLLEHIETGSEDYPKWALPGPS